MRAPIAVALLLLLAPPVLASDPVHGLDKPRPTPELSPEQDRGAVRLPGGNLTGAPTIPHRVAGHQIDLNTNRCMHCHGDDAPQAVGATPLPVSHRVDRDGEARHPFAGARYPCLACHVPQARDLP